MNTWKKMPTVAEYQAGRNKRIALKALKVVMYVAIFSFIGLVAGKVGANINYLLTFTK